MVVVMVYRGNSKFLNVLKFQKKGKIAYPSEQRRIAVAHCLAVQMLFHIRIEDFIS